MKTIAFLLATVACATAFPKSSRIVGGREAIPYSIPYQAHLTVSDGTSRIWSCSGSIISQYYILTSGRCVYGGVEVTATLGTHNISVPDPSQVTYTTTNILIHPNYTDGSSSYLNDIALVRTDFEIPFTYNIQPIGLPTRVDLMDAENYVGRIARASGWGLTDGVNDTSASTVLKYLDGRVLTNSDCFESLSAARSNSVMCMLADGGICIGDRGGPLVADYKLVGISSFWMVVCVRGYPSGFTRVSSHMNWILENSDVELV